ncbi:MAG: cysteine-rich CWC family protein, partial [Bacteroidia bacterium]|nr:cysteine-rich CWC family protein [Bacteroidia bacterium]
MKKTCPNCKNEFTCKQDDIVNCDCYLISIDSVRREFLRKNFVGCLCK